MKTTLRLPTPRAAALLASVVAALAVLPSRALAQDGAAAAAYTADQAEEGKKVFDASCATCHQPDLAGKDDAPPLSGAYFKSSWGGHKVSDLLEFVQGNMPFNAPGTLNEESYLRVVAYVLSRNGVAAGDAPLAKGAAGVIPK